MSAQGYDHDDVSVEIAAHIASTTFDQLSAEVQAATKRSILDTIGVTLAA
jgi:2-methylcitrate dehydratase PrpD